MTVFRKAAATTALFSLVASTAWAQCDVPDPGPGANGWTVSQEGYDWYAMHPAYADLKIEIFMHTPEQPRILDWAVVERPDGNVGILQHYAGEPGTSYLVSIVSNVLVDMQTGKTLGEASYSNDCELTSWDWQDTRVVVDDPGYGEVVIDLP